MILVVDNYDSFVHNLARYFRQLGRETSVRRNDRLTIGDVSALAPSHIVISPGPCTPKEAGISVALVRQFGAEIPILGVCLGHQCIGEAYGGRTVRARRPMHGKTSPIRHDGRGPFAGLPNPFEAARYHSLVIDRGRVPDELEVVAQSDDDEIMAVAHREYPVVGIQFHPEAVLTDRGYDLLRGFLLLTPTGRAGGAAA